jgi:uncharacterized protein (TIGR03437 family)
MRLDFCSLLAFALSTSAFGATPVITSVENGASYSAVLSPGSWAVVRGTGLAASATIGTTIPLPTNLGGVTVTVGGVAGPLFYVSPTQINVLIPYEVTYTAGGAVPVIVNSGTGDQPSAAYNIQLTKASPALFARDATGKGKPFIWEIDPVNGYVSVDSVVAGKEYMLYATGLGQTKPQMQTDKPGDMVELNRVADETEVYFGGVKAQVNFAGVAPTYQGVYQINVVPLAAAGNDVYLRSHGWQSNPMDVGGEQGSNVSNVTGGIFGLYPVSDPNTPPYNMPGMFSPESLGLLLCAGGFQTSFDILPDARPFTVLATSEGGSAFMQFDPAKSTYAATLTVPTGKARSGDFSNSEFDPVMDLASCSSGGCMPMSMGMMMPGNRMPPGWRMALQLLPVPNDLGETSAMGMLKSSGTFTPGSKFSIDSVNHYELSTFGGFMALPYGNDAKRTTTFKLFVDGKLIASKTVTYDVMHR